MAPVCPSCAPRLPLAEPFMLNPLPHPVMQQYPFPDIVQECQLQREVLRNPYLLSWQTSDLLISPPPHSLPRCWDRHLGRDTKVHTSVWGQAYFCRSDEPMPMRLGFGPVCVFELIHVDPKHPHECVHA